MVVVVILQREILNINNDILNQSQAFKSDSVQLVPLCITTNRG